MIDTLHLVNIINHCSNAAATVVVEEDGFLGALGSRRNGHLRGETPVLSRVEQHCTATMAELKRVFLGVRGIRNAL